MKFSILMPTYNDADSILETLESVIKQDYQNWELLISDDGSTDNTKDVIENFIKKHQEKRIKYFYQENQDQLNAIINVMDKITGDYVYILHSDDLFAADNILTKVNTYVNDNPLVDAIISSPILIDENSQVIGVQSVKKYQNKNSTMALQLLWLGRNLYIDFAFHKKEIFLNNVKNNYLMWNMPFWLNVDESASMLNVKNVDFPFFKYRVFEGNYINNPIGKLNVINGELRTAINLMKFYHIPFYKVQYIIFRIFNKLKLSYTPLYMKKETKNKYQIVKFIIEKRYGEEYKENLFLNSLVNFYKNVSNRKIKIDKIDKSNFIYYGKDMRKFNNDLLNNNLSEIYARIIKEMANGFKIIEVQSKKDEEIIKNVTKFLCIDKSIKIIVK